MGLSRAWLGGVVLASASCGEGDPTLVSQTSPPPAASGGASAGGSGQSTAAGGAHGGKSTGIGGQGAAGAGTGGHPPAAGQGGSGNAGTSGQGGAKAGNHSGGAGGSSNGGVAGTGGMGGNGGANAGTGGTGGTSNGGADAGIGGTGGSSNGGGTSGGSGATAGAHAGGAANAGGASAGSGLSGASGQGGTAGGSGGVAGGAGGGGGTSQGGSVGAGGTGVAGTGGVAGSGTGGGAGVGDAGGAGGSGGVAGSGGAGNAGASGAAGQGAAGASTCGDGVRNGDDACEGADLAGATCASIVSADATGVLTCSPYCMFDTSGCTPSIACGNMDGAQVGAPWPMAFGCPAHPARTMIPGPQNGTVVTSPAPPGDPLAGGVAVAADGSIYAKSYYGLHGFAPDGTPTFVTGLGPGFIGAETTPAIADDGTIFVAQTDCAVYAVSSGGAVEWSTVLSTEKPVCQPASPTLANGVVYVGIKQTLYSVTHDGVVQWSAPLPGIIDFHGAPAVTRDGTIVVATNAGGKTGGAVSAFTPSGSVLFSTPIPSTIVSVPAVGANGDIYVATHASLTALRADGSIRWARADAATTTNAVPAIGADGTIYVTLGEGGPGSATALMATHPDGTPAWQVPVQGWVELVTGEGRIWMNDSNALRSVDPSGVLGPAFTRPQTVSSRFLGIAPTGALVQVIGNSSGIAIVGP